MRGRTADWTRALVISGLAAAGAAQDGPVVAVAQEALPPPTEETFPHADHAGLFPLCTGCHSGVPLGEAATTFPEPELCARCHDGVAEDSVDWRPRMLRSELRFAHDEHEAALAEEDTTLACTGCHAEAEAPRMVGVYRAAHATCSGCHAHETPDHFVVGACTECHTPLAESSWDGDLIAEIAAPTDHDPPDPFLADAHGPASDDDIARCATCHVRDACSGCHVNATDVPQIQAVPAAPAGMVPPPVAARYPTPASHEPSDFLEDHEPEPGATECSTCHVREDCASCHLFVDGSPFDAIYAAGAVQAPGVGVDASEPSSHDSPFFLTGHPVIASTDEARCATCHTRPFCNGCHEDAAPPVFHEPDFVQRHAADAYGRNMECSTCHSAEVFCRACHVESGLGSSGRLGVGYHDAEPVWLLRHGQAARQSLETCQSCHTQSECLQCHSGTGSFQVSPHGPDFDARRAQERNPAICFACHLTDPLSSGR